MKNNKLIIFIIAIIFIASVNFAFAADDNDDVISEGDNEELTVVDDEIMAVEDSQDTLTSDDNTDELSAPNEEDVLGDAPVYVKPGKVTNRYYDGVIYTATFYDNDGNLLKDYPVYCGVNTLDVWNGQHTDSNGVAKFPLMVGNGNYKLYLYSAYNADEPVVDNIKVFNVLTGGKNIKMYYDAGNSYKVRVFDDNGNPVKAGQKVTFTLGSKKYVRSTDKNGYASLKITAAPGSYFIKATYKNFEIGNTVKIKNVLKAKTGKVKQASKVKFTVKFLGKNKKNKLIKVKFNKKTYKAKTNKKGVAIFKLKNPKKSGKYNVVVSYKKAKEYYTYTKY